MSQAQHGLQGKKNLLTALRQLTTIINPETLYEFEKHYSGLHNLYSRGQQEHSAAVNHSNHCIFVESEITVKLVWLKKKDVGQSST